jgi:ATP-binding cassette subfamily B protein
MKELKYLNRYLSKYKWHLILGTIFIIISNIFQIVPAQLVRHAIDLVVDNIRVYQSFDGSAVQQDFFRFLHLVFGLCRLILLMALTRNLLFTSSGKR